MTARLDQIGYWSEVKLDIVREYATAYSTVLNAPAQRNLRGHVYVDAFAGPGVIFRNKLAATWPAVH